MQLEHDAVRAAALVGATAEVSVSECLRVHSFRIIRDRDRQVRIEQVVVVQVAVVAVGVPGVVGVVTGRRPDVRTVILSRDPVPMGLATGVAGSRVSFIRKGILPESLIGAGRALVP